MYTVVVCPECHHVWIVKDRPETSRCKKCKKRKKFSKLKKFYRDDNSEAAKLARAHTQAKVNGQEGRFKEALDKGVLEFELDSVFEEEEFIEAKGLDPDQFNSKVNAILESPGSSLSRREIVENSLLEQENPSIDDVKRYLNSHDVDKNIGLLDLEKGVLAGKLELPPSIDLDEVRSEANEVVDSDYDSESNHDYQQSRYRNGEASSTSQHDLLKNAVESTSNAEEAVEWAIDKGLDKQEAASKLLRLVRSSEITSISTLEIENISYQILEGDSEQPMSLSRTEPVSEDGQNHPSESDKPDHGERNRREIMIDSIECIESPNEEQIIEYAENYGIGEQKAKHYLEKMITNGLVTKSPNGIYRMT